MYIKDHGTVRIKLDELLAKKGFSKSKFAQYAELQPTQLNRYIKNDVELISIDVLARMCNVLDCNISDILEYVPSNKTRD